MIETALAVRPSYSVDITKASPALLRHIRRERDKDRICDLLNKTIGSKPVMAITGIVAVEYLNSQGKLVTPAAVAAQIALLVWLAGEPISQIAGALTPWPWD